MNRKVSVIGAGNVGATAARSIADKELADVVILDIPQMQGVAQGKGLDMLEACPVEGSDARVLGTSDYADTAGSDIVVITAGLARKPGMSRDDLLTKNCAIVSSVTEQVMAHSPDCIIMPVTNPLDAMAQVVYRKSGTAARTGDRDGRRARLGTHARLHRAGAGRVRREHARVRARRARRHDGAPAAVLHRRRDPDHGAARQGEGRRHRAPDGARRRRNRQAARYRQRVLRARIGGRGRWSNRCSRTRRRSCRARSS